MQPTNATKNACIATAIAVLAFGVLATPIDAAADATPDLQEGTGQPMQREDCFYIDPWSFPPVEIDIWDCV